MAHFNDAWLAQHRQRWMRPDAERYIRPDADRFMPPGSPRYSGKDVVRYYWYGEERAASGGDDHHPVSPAASDSVRGVGAANDADSERELGRARYELAALGVKLALLRLAVQAFKYSPDQPRVPAGNPDGGQWTSEGGASAAVQPANEPGINDPRIISDVTPDGLFPPGAQLAQNDGSAGYPIDLLEERRLGGHAIEEHVGKGQEYLLERVQERALSIASRGDLADGLRVGSFPSLEAANKLVNSTLAQNMAKVDLVATGASPREQLDAQFSSPTGYESYARTERSQAYIRDTNGVRVIIVRDRNSAKGYRIDTAFPINLDR
jgi:hypothetical protein